MASKALREKGNARYKGARDPGAPPLVRRARAQEALDLYEKAEGASRSREDSASASKNVSRAALQLLNLNLPAFASITEAARLDLSRRYALQALEAAQRARKAGKLAGKPIDWILDVDIISIVALAELVKALEGRQRLAKAKRPRLAALEAACHVLRSAASSPSPCAIAQLHFWLAQAGFHGAVIAREAGRPTEARGLLGGIGSSVQEARAAFAAWKTSLPGPPVDWEALCSSPSSAAAVSDEATFVAARNLPALEGPLAELEQDANLETATVAASLEVAEGWRMLRVAVHDAGDLDVEGLWLAVDHFRVATRTAQGRDVEIEAEADSGLGQAWLALFPNKKAEAHAFFHRSVELVLSMFPRVLDRGISWYAIALQRVSSYQESRQRTEDQKQEKDEAPYLEQLSKEIAALKKKAEGSAEALLAYIYTDIDVEKYICPRSKADEFRAKLKERDTKAETKKQLQKALLHFHSDKNGAATYGWLWHVYISEITKQLTIKYQYFK